MNAGALFVKYWEKEGAATRKVLSRIPEGSDFRPDPKSRPAREIAWLIVREEIALGEGLLVTGFAFVAKESSPEGIIAPSTSWTTRPAALASGSRQRTGDSSTTVTIASAGWTLRALASARARSAREP